MKLLRNLWSLPNDEDENIVENFRYTYLNMWLYCHVIMNNIPEKLVLKIFNIEKQMVQHLENSYRCAYDLPF